MLLLTTMMTMILSVAVQEVLVVSSSSTSSAASVTTPQHGDDNNDSSSSSSSTNSSLFYQCLASFPMSSTSSSSSSSSLTVATTAVAAALLLLWFIMKNYIYKFYQLYQRRIQLQRWIQEYRQERSIKSKQFRIFSTFSESSSSSSHQQQYLLTATETVEQIQSGKLDLLQNVINLSYRCRKYGFSSTTYNNDGSSDFTTTSDDDAVVVPPTNVNAITEELYDDAYYKYGQELVKKLEQYHHHKKQQQQRDDNNDDDANNNNDNQLGYLFGVPISIKDQYSMNGQLQTGGLACRLKSPSIQDSSLISLLVKNAGAIPICRSNTIQLMMLAETTNNIWGTTTNPYDKTRTPGGSSGGDSALVSIGCVPIGIGGDVAGSIRIPASWCGVVGFKPTSTRITSVNGDMRPRLNNNKGSTIVIPPTPGCVTRCVNDCILFMKSMCTSDLYNKYNLNVPPLPFNNDKLHEICSGGCGDGSGDGTTAGSSTSTSKTKHRRPLRIGYFETDDWYQPCTASLRGVRETISKLQNEGHICIKLSKLPTDGWFNYGLLLKINMAEGSGRSYVEATEGEKLIPGYKMLILASQLPDVIRWMARQVLDKRRSYLLGCTKRRGISVHEFWNLLSDLSDMKTKWSNAFLEHDLDAMIFPAVPIPAMQHGMSGKLPCAFSYMFIANLLQWPCGAVPVTTVRDDEQCYYEHDGNKEDDEDKLPVDQQDAYARLTRIVMKGSAGLPMSVNVMSSAYQDEVCLGVMKEVERVVNFQAKPKNFWKSD